MKYFWICLFTFLTFLVVAAAIFRPDTLDGIFAYTGLYLAAIGWALVSLAFLLPISFAVGSIVVLYFTSAQSAPTSCARRTARMRCKSSIRASLPCSTTPTSRSTPLSPGSPMGRAAATSSSSTAACP